MPQLFRNVNGSRFQWQNRERRPPRKDIDDFITKRRDGGSSPATTNRVLCRIKNMLKKATDWGYIDTNPAAGISLAREVVKEADFLTREEVAALLQPCNDQMCPLIITAVYTGMRFGKLMVLEWRDVNPDKGLITIKDPKNRETRHVPMNKAVKEALDIHKSSQAKEAGAIVRPVFPYPKTGSSYVDSGSA